MSGQPGTLVYLDEELKKLGVILVNYGSNIGRIKLYLHQYDYQNKSTESRWDIRNKIRYECVPEWVKVKFVWVRSPYLTKFRVKLDLQGLK